MWKLSIIVKIYLLLPDVIGPQMFLIKEIEDWILFIDFFWKDTYDILSLTVANYPQFLHCY